MSSTKRLGCCVLAAFIVSGCATPHIACPPQHSAEGKTRSLVGTSVFEGVPQNLVGLMPDLESSEWDIAMNQRAAKRRGESMYLVCRYQGLADTATLQIPDGATSCKVEGAAVGLAAGCRRPGKSVAQKQD